MDNLLETIKRIGIGKLVVLVVAVILMFGLVATLFMRVNTPSMALLYGGLDAKEASQITQMLAAQGVKYEVRGESSVYVAQSRVGELRLKVAGEGLVGSGTAGYEIFDKSSSFGTTSLVQNINSKRALEGELARTIMSLPSVNSARVHLVMPKKRPFMRTSVEPTASVALNLGARTLTEEQIASIGHLVAASVPSLKAGAVTIVDQRGKLLSQGKGANSQSGLLNTQSKIKRSIEQQYESNILRLLERITGQGKASVTVNALIDFNRVEENVEIFDPDQQIARSEQTVEQSTNAQNTTGNPAVGVTGNVPGGNTTGTSVGSSENNTTVEATVNYEIGKTVRHQIKEAGGILQVSVAVLVEGKYRISENGEQEYIAYSDNDKQKLDALVKSAIGFDKKRGDKVEIIDMAFTPIEEITTEEPMLSKSEIFKLVEYALMVLAILIVMFVVIRPIMKSIMSTSGATTPPTPGETIIGPDGQPLEVQSVDPAGNVITIRPSGNITVDNGDEATVDLEQVEGKVRESAVKKVKDIVEAYPEESVNVVRGWMAPDAGKRKRTSKE